MRKKQTAYHQHRENIGNHTNWQDKKQGGQKAQDRRVQRLARRPGLHTGNVHRQNASYAMVQLLSILSTAQTSSARLASTSKTANQYLTKRNRAGNATNNSNQITEPTVPMFYQGRDKSLAYAQGYLSIHSPASSPNNRAMNFSSRNKTFSSLRQKRDASSSQNIPNRILDLMSNSHFGYRLRNKLDEIFRYAERAPDVMQAPAKDRNLFLLFECVRQMGLFIKNNDLPRTDESQEMLNALLSIADSLNTPHEKELINTFKQHFYTNRTDHRVSSQPLSTTPHVLTEMHASTDRGVTKSDTMKKITIAGQSRFVDELLIEGLDYYGLDRQTFYSDGQKMAVIATYLNQQIFDTSLDEWCLNLEIMKSMPESLTNVQLGDYVYNKIYDYDMRRNSSIEERSFYRNNVLSKSLPIVTLKLSGAESLELNDLIVTQPQWGFVHAGAKLLRDSGAELEGLRLTDIEDIGITLHTMLNQSAVPQEFRGYFRLPALFYYAATKPRLSDNLKLSELDMRQVYVHYFDHIKNWEKRNNPFERLPDLIQGWKTRTALAKDQLASHNVSDEWVSSYLNSHSEAQFETKNWVSTDIYVDGEFKKIEHQVANGTVTLANIDLVFKEQNRQLADVVYDIDKLLISQVLNSLSEAEQQFVQQSKVDRVRVQFNAQDSVKSVPLPPAARMGMVQSDALIYRIPERIDLLQCTFNGVERIYELNIAKHTGQYVLNLVDRDRQSLLWLLDDMTVPLNDPDYKLRVTSHFTLKEQTGSPQQLIENLAEHHRKNFLTVLNDKGYDKTTREKVTDFLLGLVPFYTCITESAKGNEKEAIPACMIDVAGLIPFAGQAAYTGLRFGTALSRSAVMALRYGARETTLKGMLRQTGKELIMHFPSVAQEISPRIVSKLGAGFLRSVDPGFELLASGGAKGIRAIGNIFAKIPKKSPGVVSLLGSLSKKATGFRSEPFITDLKTESLFSPLYGRKLDVAVVGEEQGHQVWSQVNQGTGELFGEKFIRNAEGNLEVIAVKLRHRNQELGEVRGPMVSKIKPPAVDGQSGSELRIYTLGEIGIYELTNNLKIIKRQIGGSYYIQYYINSPTAKKGSEVLVVSAHGGFTDSDIAAPVVVLPSDITIQMLTPHGTKLKDPNLDHVVNAGKDLKAYVTIDNRKVTKVDFLPQQGHSRWLYSDNYDPTDIDNTLGRKEGLQNYRHIRYEGESDSLISSVLIKNRELVKKGKAALTDILTVDAHINEASQSSLQKASIQRVIDLDREGKLRNVKGERYKKIAFCHCRCRLQPPFNFISTYIMLPSDLEDVITQGVPKSSTISDVKMTVLHREDVNKPFEIQRFTIGRFMFIPIQKSIQSTESSVELASLNQTNF